jgi:hypothetical protein
VQARSQHQLGTQGYQSRCRVDRMILDRLANNRHDIQEDRQLMPEGDRRLMPKGQRLSFMANS